MTKMMLTDRSLHPMAEAVAQDFKTRPHQPARVLRHHGRARRQRRPAPWRWAA